jgi:hypothetical protein
LELVAELDYLEAAASSGTDLHTINRVLGCEPKVDAVRQFKQMIFGCRKVVCRNGFDRDEDAAPFFDVWNGKTMAIQDKNPPLQAMYFGN